MVTPKIKVFIVDDYIPMRESLRKLLAMEPDMEVCGEAGDVESAYRSIQAHTPDLVVVDLILGRESGLELVKKLNRQMKDVPVLVLTMLPEHLNVDTVLSHGARGYIMKSESPDHILAAMRRVLAGEVYLSVPMKHQRADKNHADQ